MIGEKAGALAQRCLALLYPAVQHGIPGLPDAQRDARLPQRLVALQRRLGGRAEDAHYSSLSLVSKVGQGTQGFLHAAGDRAEAVVQVRKSGVWIECSGSIFPGIGKEIGGAELVSQARANRRRPERLQNWYRMAGR